MGNTQERSHDWYMKRQLTPVEKCIVEFAEQWELGDYVLDSDVHGLLAGVVERLHLRREDAQAYLGFAERVLVAEVDYREGVAKDDGRKEGGEIFKAGVVAWLMSRMGCTWKLSDVARDIESGAVEKFVAERDGKE